MANNQEEAFYAHDSSEVMESITKDNDAMSDKESATAEKVNNVDKTIKMKAVIAPQAPRADAEEDNEAAPQVTEKHEGTQEVADKQVEVDNNMSLEEEPKLVCNVDPKEWQQIHDK